MYRASCKFWSRRIGSWGRCYDHNFQQFLTFFGEKIGVFLKNQCYDQNLALFWVKNANIFAEFFGENILKIITSVPGRTQTSVAQVTTHASFGPSRVGKLKSGAQRPFF
jgi:hypothetical protein